MDISTIKSILREDRVDEISGVPVSAIIFMLYYGLELKHFLLNMSNDFLKRYPLKQYHNEASTTYLSGSVAQGMYVNTRQLDHARDIDIVTIYRKYPIKDNCHYEEFPAHEWLLKSRLEGSDNYVCASGVKLNLTSTESDDRYLNIKVLPDTPPGYVLLQKCRRHPLPVQTVDDLYVSSLKTTEARVQFWFDSQQDLHKQYPHLPYRDDIKSREDGTLLYHIESHGPAATVLMGGSGLTGTVFPAEIDIVFAIPYPVKWPSIANEWVKRKRPSGWPTNALIEEIKSDGCTLIPKGSIGSPMEEYEWRISFTGDLKLARSLSLVQREIMHIIKALVSEPQYNQEIRDKGINLTSDFESYQFLNLMYLETEQISLGHWVPENIAQMLFYLIDKYLEQFHLRHLSHYFIKSRNIFAKYHTFSDEELDDVLYSLLRIRRDPLGQILQQQRLLRLSPKAHQMVYMPFVEEVIMSGYASHKLYVNTLVRLTKAHILEGFYNSASTYAMEALEFYYRIVEDSLSDSEYMDLMFTVAVSCHRNGFQDQTLTYLEKLYHVMQGKTTDILSQIFGQGTHAHILALYARTLVSFLKRGTHTLDSGSVIKTVKQFYHKARSTDASNVPVLLDTLNSFIRIGNKEEVEEMFSVISGCFSGQDYTNDAFEDTATISENNPVEPVSVARGSDAVSPVNTGQIEDELQVSTDVEYETQTSVLPNNIFSEDTDFKEAQLAECAGTGREKEPGAEILYDRQQYLKTGSDTDLNFSEADLDDIDTELLRDYYRMKAFKALRLEEKAEMIRNRIERKIDTMQKKGTVVSYKMLQSAYERYEEIFHTRTHPNSKLFFDDMLSVHEKHVIYSSADKPVLDQNLNGIFDLAESTVIFVPIDVIFLHMKIQFYKTQGDVKQVEEELSLLEKAVQKLVPWTDTLVGQYLIACHLDWLGQKEAAQENIAIVKDRYSTIKELLAPPDLKDKITEWIDQMFTVVATHEPHNKYLDDLFAV